MRGFFAYTRVSTVKQGQKGVSLQEQHDIINRFAQSQGLTIRAWYEERQTAAKMGRPIFNQLLGRLRRGEADGLIVHKIDRGARNLRDWVNLGDLIDQGIKVHFAGDSVDMHSRGGRLSADLQAVVATDYIRNLREETRKGFYGRLKQGLYPLPAPIGYSDKGRGQPKVPDAVHGELVRQAFELYASGHYSLATLGDEMQRRGLRNRRGGRVTRNGLSVMLNSLFYTGIVEIKKTQEVFQGIHEPLISKLLYERTQLALKGKTQDRHHLHQFLFQKLWTCRHCQSTLIGEHQKGHVYYRCHTRSCETKCIREEVLERVITDVLQRIHLGPKELRYLRFQLNQQETEWVRSQEAQREAVKLRQAQLRDRLNRLTDALLDGLVDREQFAQRKAALLLEQSELESSTKQPDCLPVVRRCEKILELAKSLYLLYQTANRQEKRELVRIVTSNRWVDRKNGSVELPEPFLFLEKRGASRCGDPNRVVPRTKNDLLAQLMQWFASHPEWEMPSINHPPDSVLARCAS